MPASPGKPIVPILTLATAVAFMTAGCGDDQRTAYCVDKANNKVVDNGHCDSGYHGGGGSYFIWTGNPGSSLTRGDRVPSGGSRINPADATARADAGLPKSGSIGGKSGGFGTSIAKGGSSSGGHGGESAGHGGSGS